jgi:hypothetical protein
MGAAVIPYAFAGRIGIDFGIFDFDFDFDFADFGILEGLDWPSGPVYFAPGVSGDWWFCACWDLGLVELSFDAREASWTVLVITVFSPFGLILDSSC